LSFLLIQKKSLGIARKIVGYWKKEGVYRRFTLVLG